MSEMLGNQYFMARNYAGAVKELEPVYLRDPFSKSVRRKLIIGYTQIGKIEKALELFNALVKDDVLFIINADPVFDDCPCNELKKDLKPSSDKETSPDINIYNGVLWLFCDPKISLDFLEKSSMDLPENEGIKGSIRIIKEAILTKHN